MSTLWTPSGEHTPTGEPPSDGGDPAVGPSGQTGAPPDTAELSPEEIEAVRRLHHELRSTPAVDVIANHAVQIFQLAVIYLGIATPPDEGGRPPVADLANAGVAIDSMAALVDGLGTRLGENEASLRDALSELQMLYVRVADAADDADSAGSP